jgi:aspartate kinase
MIRTLAIIFIFKEKRDMTVMKFGGTSVEDSKRINNVLDIALKQLEFRGVVLVSSAMGKTTDRIIDACEAAEKGDIKAALSFMEDIKDLHFTASREMLDGESLNEVIIKLDNIFGQFASLLKGVAMLRDCTLRSKDTFLAFGERLSTALIAARASARGINVTLLDSREFIITNDNFGEASVNFEETNRLVKNIIKPGRNKLYVAQGFIGSNGNGTTTTLGRGGSDYSASIIGAALGAEEIQIWTDVDGIMSSDPRQVRGVKTIPHITYGEAGELAYFGAKVVHPATIQPAVRASIPVKVLNSLNPDFKGTTISKEVLQDGLKAISHKKNITVVNIESTRMLNAYGFLHRIFTVFDKYKTSIDLVTTSEVSVSVTIERSDNLEDIMNDLSPFCHVDAKRENSIICLVGQNLWKDSVFLSKVFHSCSGVPVRMISLGSSDINLSLVVPQDKADHLIQKMHDLFLK